MNTRSATTVVAHRQHSATTVAMPPPGASPEATLKEARQLLHNPPGSHASPSAAKQWSHDVDQLIVAAINTLPHGGRQANRLGACQCHHRHTHAHLWCNRAHRRHRVCHRQYAQQVSLRWIYGLNSSVVAQVRMVASPSSASGRGAATLTGTLVRWTPPL
jgi:hypothetical protein